VPPTRSRMRAKRSSTAASDRLMSAPSRCRSRRATKSRVARRS
jgi:hypothetical protein